MVDCITIRDTKTGSSAKVLAGFGFNCFSFVACDEQGERELLWAEADFESGDKRPSGSGTPLLFPFPGRLPGMVFSWDGVEYPLESNDGRGNGIHGFVHCRPWRVLEATESHVVGQFQASIDDPSLLSRWPADFCIQAKYSLSGNRLDCELTVSNPDSKPLPCGLGAHPYFRLPLGAGDASRSHVRLPVRSQWELLEMLPTGRRLDVDRSLADGASFQSLSLDNVFTSLQFDRGWFRAEILDPSENRRLNISFDESFSECVVYTPPHREAICIEPYSCVPGAAARTDFQHGWKVLAPGESWSAKVIVELSGGGE